MPTTIAKGHFKIGTKEFVAKQLDIEFESIAGEDSGRNDNGVMEISWVLNRIRKLKITMPPCSSSDVSELLSLVQGKEYDITYWDTLDNNEKTIHAYTSTSSASCYSGVLYNGLYQDLTFNAIELGGELV